MAGQTLHRKPTTVGREIWTGQACSRPSTDVTYPFHPLIVGSLLFAPLSPFSCACAAFWSGLPRTASTRVSACCSACSRYSSSEYTSRVATPTPSGDVTFSDVVRYCTHLPSQSAVSTSGQSKLQRRPPSLCLILSAGGGNGVRARVRVRKPTTQHCFYRSTVLQQYYYYRTPPTAGGVDPSAALTLLGSVAEIPFGVEAVPASPQSLELNWGRDLTMEGTPSIRLWVEAAVLALGATLNIAAEKTGPRAKGVLIVWVTSVAGAIRAERV